MKLKDFLYDFCKEHEKYTYCSTVDTAGCRDGNCVGIAISQGNSYMDMLMELTEFLTTEGYTDVNSELEGAFVSDFGEGTIVYFYAT